MSTVADWMRLSLFRPIHCVNGEASSTLDQNESIACSGLKKSSGAWVSKMKPGGLENQRKWWLGGVGNRGKLWFGRVLESLAPKMGYDSAKLGQDSGKMVSFSGWKGWLRHLGGKLGQC